jgi:hypothetical protein
MATYTDPFDIYRQSARTRQRVTEQNAIRDQLAALTGGGARAYESLTRTYQQGMEPRTAGFAKRGLGNSGIFQRAMQEYAANQQRSLGDVARSQQEGLQELTAQEASSANDYKDYMDSLAMKKQQEISQAAGELQDWSPFTGLYS